MTTNEAEHIGEVVADTIADAIETAQAQEERAQETAEQIAEAAMEGERGRRIETLERRFDEWESQQSELSQAMAATAMGLAELSGKLDTLTQLQSPTPPLQNEKEDGQPESLEPETVVVVEPEAPVVEMPVPPEPKKKRHRWI